MAFRDPPLALGCYPLARAGPGYATNLDGRRCCYIISRAREAMRASGARRPTNDTTTIRSTLRSVIELVQKEKAPIELTGPRSGAEAR
jgi:hypothetical protein